MDARSVYDCLGDSYHSPTRETTSCFHRLQDNPIGCAVFSVAWHNHTTPEELYVLSVGPGNRGNHGLFDREPRYYEGVRPDRVAYLDISPVVLDRVTDHHRKFFRQDPLETYLADGQYMSSVVDREFDVVLAALCDHIEDQDKFYREVMKILKPGGGFITTYPHIGINSIIREKIYRIPVEYTRFMVNGEELFLRSHLMTKDQLKKLYDRNGFVDASTHDVGGFFEGFYPSETIIKAANIIGREVNEIPILVHGLGFKPL